MAYARHLDDRVSIYSGQISHVASKAVQEELHASKVSRPRLYLRAEKYGMSRHEVSLVNTCLETHTAQQSGTSVLITHSRSVVACAHMYEAMHTYTM
jgi:hypothetical protein